MAKGKGSNREKTRKQSGSALQPEAVDEAPILSGEVLVAEDIIASLLVTTGSFTQEAVREASRGSAPEIDLIDGEQLIDKLKELSLGVKTERVVVEQVMIDVDWFQNI